MPGTDFSEQRNQPTFHTLGKLFDPPKVLTDPRLRVGYSGRYSEIAQRVPPDQRTSRGSPEAERSTRTLTQ